MTHCDHTWQWEVGRMLCTRCGVQRPTDETLEDAQARIAELETEVAALKARRCDHCRHWSGVPGKSSISLCGVRGSFLATGGFGTDADFYCQHWTERRAG